MNDLSFSSFSPALLCDIYQKAHSWKVFLCRKNPTQLHFSAHKKQLEKRMASVGEVRGGSWREMIDRDIYVTVKLCNQ